MVDLVVQRWAGDKQGEDIVDPLIATEAVAIQRGRNELDKSARGKLPVAHRVVFRSGVQPGMLAEVDNSLQGSVYRGKVTRVEYRFDRAQTRLSMNVERVTEFQA